MDNQGQLTYLSPSFEMHTLHAVAEFMPLAKPGGPTSVKDAQWELLLADMKTRRPYRDCVIQFLTARAQRELQRSQAMLDRLFRLFRLFRLSSDAVCVASMRDGRVLLANPAFPQFIGREESQVMGRNGIELGLWRGEDPMLALGRAIPTTGWVRDFRSVAWSADGAQHRVLITAASFDWDGEEVAVMATRDVTETERAKQEGDANLDNAVVGVCLVRNHRLARVNPQLERMLGQPSGSLVGKPTEGSPTAATSTCTCASACRHRAHRGRRHWHRRRRRAARLAVPAVHAGRQFHHAALRRERTGAVDLPRAGNADGRRRRPRQRRPQRPLRVGRPAAGGRQRGRLHHHRQSARGGPAAAAAKPTCSARCGPIRRGAMARRVGDPVQTGLIGVGPDAGLQRLSTFATAGARSRPASGMSAPSSGRR
jgi:PAS domain S-box-containing protein